MDIGLALEIVKHVKGVLLLNWIVFKLANLCRDDVNHLQKKLYQIEKKEHFRRLFVRVR